MAAIFCSFLPSVSAAGEHAQEFLELFRTLIEDPAGQWKSYLALRGALPKIGALIDKVSSGATLHGDVFRFLMYSYCFISFVCSTASNFVHRK